MEIEKIFAQLLELTKREKGISWFEVILTPLGVLK